jgi:hypothetical protein
VGVTFQITANTRKITVKHRTARKQHQQQIAKLRIDLIYNKWVILLQCRPKYDEQKAISFGTSLKQT